jgi:hypothetical protein
VQRARFGADDDVTEPFAGWSGPFGQPVRQTEHRSGDVKAALLAGEVERPLPLDPVSLVVLVSGDHRLDELPEARRCPEGQRRSRPGSSPLHFGHPPAAPVPLLAGDGRYRSSSTSSLMSASYASPAVSWLGVAWNYEGRRVGRAHPATWAEAGVIVVAELGSGADDPRPQAPSLIARAVGNLPEGLGRPRLRADAGYFDAKVAWSALEAGADYAIAAKRNRALWRSLARVPEDAWVDADMAGAQVATCFYQPAGWPEATRTIVRRVLVDPDRLRADPRSRRRRTIAPDQLAFALAGGAADVYAYSFICTNLSGPPERIEHWFRERAWIEERHKDSKWGYGLIHLPSGRYRVNRIWMWSAYLATNLSVFTQTLGQVNVDGVRAHAKRARRDCSACPPGCSPTPGRPSCASPPVPAPRSTPPGRTCGPCPPPPPAEHPAGPGRRPGRPGRNSPAAPTRGVTRPNPGRNPNHPSPKASNSDHRHRQALGRTSRRPTCGSGSDLSGSVCDR